MKLAQWLFYRWRASRLRDLSFKAFARGRTLQKQADDYDGKANKLGGQGSAMTDTRAPPA